MINLDELNAQQREAVEYVNGPLLVLSGAGTGKTRVLTTKLAYLIQEKNLNPHSVCAVTFTNKAAKEMAQRTAALLGREVAGWMLGTFHSIAARFLRRHAEYLGLDSNYTIINEDDQIKLLKQLLSAAQIDDERVPASHVVDLINRFKDKALTPAKLTARDVPSYVSFDLPKLYRSYQERLRSLNACDFGDLLLHNLTLFEEQPNTRFALQDRIRYMLVDEYQDTNHAQYAWLRVLVEQHNNVCCVGDEDQAIFSWRGAEVGNILNFSRDFQGAHIVRLEQNYRSTQNILTAASAVIGENRQRLGKKLWCAEGEGEKLSLKALWDGDEEARSVGDEIEALQRRDVPLSDIAILVRTGWQTRAFEERFIQIGVPYQVLSGARFYERQEVRDALAYFRLVVSPSDDLAFERIINVPKRGIGDSTLQKLRLFAGATHSSLLEATVRMTQTDELTSRLRGKLVEFLKMVNSWRERASTLDHVTLAQTILEESGYVAMWQSDKDPTAASRLDNIKELVQALQDFDSLGSFLEHVSLVMDNVQDVNIPKVSLMTLHASKGLEYKYVFLPGWEEDLFPSRRSLDEQGENGLEEERRLAYVGLTRARVKLFLSWASRRQIFGSWQTNYPSRFLRAIPASVLDNPRALSAEALLPSQNFTRSNNTYQPKLSAPPLDDFDDSPAGLYPGNRVFHQKFGYGVIISRSGDVLDIRFEHSGHKRVVSTFVSLPEDVA